MKVIRILVLELNTNKEMNRLLSTRSKRTHRPSHMYFDISCFCLLEAGGGLQQIGVQEKCR